MNTDCSYFHINGLIHRDVKAANLLIDDDGTVLLGDLGVAAFLWDSETSQAGPSNKPRTVNFDSSSRPSNHQRSAAAPAAPQRPSILGKRKSFVGTPCWMAPEVINGKQYDASADIWSFGITAIELAQGRAPRSRLNPHQVLVKTVTEAPPQLERNGGPHRYSSAFAEIVAMCLCKDPSKRPSASELLQMSFFRGARKPSYLCSTILKGLPPLTQRQERRKQPSILTHATMESWDFSLSLPASPTTSVYSHHRRPMNLLPQDGVFEMEDGSGDEDRGEPEGSGDAPDEHVRIDGKSDAESYVAKIRERQHRSAGGRSWHSHSRSGSHQSLHSHHSRHHSRGQSHDEPRSSTVHSIQEVIVQEVPGESESSDTDRDQDQDHAHGTDANGIPVGVSPKSAQFATLNVPSLASTTGPAPSSSPATSSRSSASATSSSSSPLSPSTPPPGASLRLQPGKLWRKLAGKVDSSETEKEKADAGAQPPTPTSTSARKRSFGAVLGRTAHMSADLVRTASRTMSRECIVLQA